MPCRVLALVCLAAMPSAYSVARVSDSFVWDDATGQSDPDKPLTVYVSRPDVVTSDTPVWFVMHGASRNADDYRDYLANAPAAADALVIAPEFTTDDWSGSRRYNLGNVAVSESNPAARPRQDWSFSKIEPLFDHVRSSYLPQLTADSYSMYGHSAGAQFVHRYLMWEPDARVKIAVAANAGWYTLPLAESSPSAYPYDWPYSARDTPDYEPATGAEDNLPLANLIDVFDDRLIVLLGEEDTQRTSSLRQTVEADAQGPHRLARGQFFYAEAEAEADRLGADFRWGLDFVPGVGHSGSQMAVAAAEYMRLADAAPGDYDADGIINQNDLAVWRASYGATIVPGLRADGTSDGLIDAADYTLWRDRFAEQALTVPEPAMVRLSVFAIAKLAGRPRRRLRYSHDR